MPKKNKIILCFWREIWSICRPLASWMPVLPGTVWVWICAQRLFITTIWMAWNINQGLFHFVLLCFLVAWFWGFLLNWFQRAKESNLVLWNKGCEIHGQTLLLSPEQVIYKSWTGKSARVWWAGLHPTAGAVRGRGLREEWACPGPQQGEAGGFHPALGRASDKECHSCLRPLTKTHFSEEDFILGVSVPEITPSLQLEWSVGYFSLEKSTIVHPSGFRSEDVLIQVLCWMSETMLLIC